MKLQIIALSGILLSAMTTGTLAASGKFGAGVKLDYDLGLSASVKTSANDFLQFGFTPSEGAYKGTADYIFTYPYRSGFHPYWGLGVLAVDNDDNAFYNDIQDDDNDVLGARVPLGFLYEIRQVPVELSAELAPTLMTSRENDLYLEGSINARVIF